MIQDNTITVETTVHAPIDIVWECWTAPEHIMQWNTASEDWHCPQVENDVREGGTFLIRMEAKDGSEGFDFGGTYTKVLDQKELCYTMDDGRTVTVLFEEHDGKTHITETFDPESQNSREMQQQGWQAILDTFARYCKIR